MSSMPRSPPRPRPRPTHGLPFSFLPFISIPRPPPRPGPPPRPRPLWPTEKTKQNSDLSDPLTHIHLGNIWIRAGIRYKEAQSYTAAVSWSSCFLASCALSPGAPFPDPDPGRITPWTGRTRTCRRRSLPPLHRSRTCPRCSRCISHNRWSCVARALRGFPLYPVRAGKEKKKKQAKQVMKWFQ